MVDIKNLVILLINFAHELEVSTDYPKIIVRKLLPFSWSIKKTTFYSKTAV